MTDLRQANIAALPHLVAIRDEWADIARVAKKHAGALDEDHRFKSLAEDAVLISAAYLQKFNDAVNHYDPAAPRATLDAPMPPDAATFAGTMLVGDELEALRTHRIGETVRHAQTLAAARFTPEEQGRWNLLRQLAQAADENVTPPLTEEQLAELAALDADQRWSVNTQAEAWGRVDALLTADSDTLASYNASDGWAE